MAALLSSISIRPITVYSRYSTIHTAEQLQKIWEDRNHSSQPAIGQDQEEPTKAYNPQLYRVIPCTDFSPADQKAAAQKAFERFERETGFQEDYGLSIKEVAGFDEGCCHGELSSLFHKIKKRGLSIEQSAATLCPEDVFFHHLLQDQNTANSFIERLRTREIEEIHTEQNTENRCEEFGSDEELSKMRAYRETRLQICEEKLKKVSRNRIYLLENDPLFLPCFVSRLFLPDTSHHLYQSILEEGLRTVSTAAPIRGTIHIPHHVMGFQYGPEEYYIYDSFSQETGGLFKYHDPESL